MDRRSEAERRESFRQINANISIEGVVMDASDVHLQSRVIRGELTHEEAIAEVRKDFEGGTAKP